MTFFAPAHKNIETPKHKLTISGTIYFSSISEGGIQRDNSNPPAIPFGKFTMYIVRFISADSIPKLVKSFTTNENGVFLFLFLLVNMGL